MSPHIGIFDSGVGGLTVMRRVAQALPHATITYFGDTARLPYGEKSPDTIIRFSQERISFLEDQGVDLIVIACHTASSLALEAVRSHCRVPLLGVIKPSIEQAIASTRNHRIAILGTRGTVASGVYQAAIQERLPNAYLVPIACPLFVPLVEERLERHPATRLIVRDYLAAAIEAQVDTVLLGCTHYPLLDFLLCEELGEAVTLVDAAPLCAEQVRQQVWCEGKQSLVHPRTHRFFVSDDADKFRRLSKHILGHDIGEVALLA